MTHVNKRPRFSNVPEKIELAGEENRQKMSEGLGVYGDVYSILFIKH